MSRYQDTHAMRKMLSMELGKETSADTAQRLKEVLLKVLRCHSAGQSGSSVYMNRSLWIVISGCES